MKIIEIGKITVITSVLFIAACESNTETAQSPQTKTTVATQNVAQTSHVEKVPAKRAINFVKMSRGGKLYKENCAECHGSNGEGGKNWNRPGPDGKYPAPPLNGTGHAWHHPMALLKKVIKNGSPMGKDGKRIGSMPGWGHKLNDQDINDVITWFQAKWPDEIYSAWDRNNKRPR